MRRLPLARAFTLMESGPVVFITTHDGRNPNVMTLSWSMVCGFTPRFAITTGGWNHSWAALRQTRECVIAIPGADLLDTVVGVGTCSGADTDKFARFGLTPKAASVVAAPLIAECLANIECRVIDCVRKHDMLILEGVAAHVERRRTEQRMLHAVGDGRFVADGERFDRRRVMRSKLPSGV